MPDEEYVGKTLFMLWGNLDSGVRTPAGLR